MCIASVVCLVSQSDIGFFGRTARS